MDSIVLIAFRCARAPLQMSEIKLVNNIKMWSLDFVMTQTICKNSAKEESIYLVASEPSSLFCNRMTFRYAKDITQMKTTTIIHAKVYSEDQK